MSAEKRRYIFLEARCEDDSLILYGKLTDDLAASILERIELVKRLEKTDKGLTELAFHSDIEAYEWNGGLSDWLEAEKSCEGQGWEYERWAIVGKLPALTATSIKLDTVRIHMTTSGFFYWSVLPKHSDSKYETSWMSALDLERPPDQDEQGSHE